VCETASQTRAVEVSFKKPRIFSFFKKPKKPKSPNFRFFRPPGTLVPGGLVLLQMFFFSRHEISELPRPIAMKLCHVIAIWVNFIIQVQKFGGPPPKEIGGQKHAISGTISDNFKLRSRISLEREKISKIGKRCVHR